MKDLINRSYEAIKARGLINENTTIHEFMNKISEEYGEIGHEYYNLTYYKFDSWKDFKNEVVDLMTVCVMYLHHNGYDVIKEFEKTVIKNEKRAKETR